jgi:hypothetical protein
MSFSISLIVVLVRLIGLKFDGFRMSSAFFSIMVICAILHSSRTLWLFQDRFAFVVTNLSPASGGFMVCLLLIPSMPGADLFYFFQFSTENFLSSDMLLQNLCHWSSLSASVSFLIVLGFEFSEKYRIRFNFSKLIDCLFTCGLIVVHYAS